LACSWKQSRPILKGNDKRGVNKKKTIQAREKGSTYKKYKEASK